MGWLARQLELSRGTTGQNVRAMEGMRGFAVFLVFLVHFVSLSAPWRPGNTFLASFAETIHTVGNCGVDLFFVLSGYLIYGSLISRPQPFFAYMRRRLVRIYPTFCVVFFAYLCLSFVYPSESKIPTANADAWVYILQNFALLPGIFPISPMITVAWSLSYEMFFYLLVPAAIFFLGMRKRRPQWRFRFFLSTAAAITIYCATYGGHIRFVMFIAGMLVFESLTLRKITPPKDIYVAVAFIVGLLTTAAPSSGPAAAAFKILVLAGALFITCYSTFYIEGSKLARAFSWTPLRRLGNMSYSYYLLHGLALKAGFIVVSKLIPPTPHGIIFVLILLPLMFVLTLVPSMMLFILIERPFSLKRSLPTLPAARERFSIDAQQYSQHIHVPETPVNMQAPSQGGRI